MIGTEKYKAPEIINKCPYTEKADIFSLGIVIFKKLFNNVINRLFINYFIIINHEMIIITG